MPDVHNDLTMTNLRLSVGDVRSEQLVQVRVRDGRVVDIAHQGRSTEQVREVIDFDGRYLHPGLWDHHVHLEEWATTRLQLDLRDAKSAADATEKVRARLSVAPPPSGTPLLGYGFRDGLWPDSPTTALLDATAPTTPVALTSNDLHCGWLNSAALRLVGRVAPPDALLREVEFTEVLPLLSLVAQPQLDALVHEAAMAAAARGVVGVVELQRTDNLTAWQRRHAGGTQCLRIECGVYPEDLDAVAAFGLRSGDQVPGTDGLITQGPLKIITDGSLNTRTAYCRHSYPGMDGNQDAYGRLLVQPDQLVALMGHARSLGLDCAVHAIGDRTNGLALDAFAEVGCTGTIEHVQLVDRADVARFAALGVAASVQPSHVIDDRDVADRYWAGRTNRAFAFADLLRAGAELRLGSDAPVAPLDPWISIAAAVYRTDTDREPWHPEQALTVTQALRASTRQHDVAVGMAADLVVTELDPQRADASQLRAMPVSACMVGGRWTHFEAAQV